MLYDHASIYHNIKNTWVIFCKIIHMDFFILNSNNLYTGNYYSFEALSPPRTGYIKFLLLIYTFLLYFIKDRAAMNWLQNSMISLSLLLCSKIYIIYFLKSCLSSLFLLFAAYSACLFSCLMFLGVFVVDVISKKHENILSNHI